MKGVVVLVVSVIIVAALVMAAAANTRSADFGPAAAGYPADGPTFSPAAAGYGAAAAFAIQPVAAPYGTGAMDTVDTSQEDSARALGAAVLANHLAAQRPVDLECPDEGVPCPQEVVW